MPKQEEFDYIIVGAGSAECVLAARLTEDPAVTVLVLEAGGTDRSLFVRMPIALSIPLQSEKYSWRYFTEPEPYTNAATIMIGEKAADIIAGQTPLPASYAPIYNPQDSATPGGTNA